ncbi:ABC transporter ATP-binding protein [Natronomonas halophila]|uniref:ABC transporter ATP-binding protein n=1 Tax=Natronomonas halophila TaxID=2747817 RepID=UPI0015B51B2C|nr:ABC transporter ATP-binding protein [Natronomonas halophila]QLD84359.1 ABC transporter ATP-binding protein [Natronomonas halophila]
MSSGSANLQGADVDLSVPESERTVLELDGIEKSFNGTRVIRDLSISVEDGELMTLLGPSGCGKTTTLRLIAGLERPDGGIVRIDGESVSGSEFVAPEDRDVGVVFQEFALFPHLSARENIAFGIQEWDEAEREERVDELLELVGLKSHGEKHPEELSGGQQQRVALARSLAPEPSVLLLDEPFSNLDVDLRVEMREEVRSILKKAGVTAISVTHDQEEAMSISDRVAVMSEGQIEQVGTPEEVFQQPKSRFVAGFLGHASFVSGRVTDDCVETGVGCVPLDRINGLTEEYTGSQIDLMVRPDDVYAEPADPAEANGEVVHRRYLGPTVLYRVEIDSGDVVGCMHNHADQVSLDEPVFASLDADHDLAWFPRGERKMADGGQ